MEADGPPVVHVTQGTYDVDPADLLLPALDGLATADVRVATATGGPALPPDRVPANARQAPLLPYDWLLPRTSVVVTNGGWGGVLAALAAGVPWWSRAARWTSPRAPGGSRRREPVRTCVPAGPPHPRVEKRLHAIFTELDLSEEARTRRRVAVVLTHPSTPLTDGAGRRHPRSVTSAPPTTRPIEIDSCSPRQHGDPALLTDTPPGEPEAPHEPA